MTFAHPEASRPTREGRRPASDSALETWFGARARRVFGMTALAILMVWIAVEAGQGPKGPDLTTDRVEAVQSLQQDEEPVFDGRGKWTGYAR